MGSRTGHTYQRELQPSPKSVLRDYAETILVCVVFVVFARAFVFQQSEIPSGSMEDTVLVGDFVLVNRFLYAPTWFAWEEALLPTREIRRGDVVVFKHPHEPEQDFIKRVIGLPGDSVEMRQGTVLVDGRRLDEEAYLNPLYRPSDSFGPVEVEPDHYFLMGDHRNRSSDSRRWGTVRHDLIKGRAFLILFSTRVASTPGGDPGRITPVSLVRKVYNLVFRSRWNRCFSAIR